MLIYLDLAVPAATVDDLLVDELICVDLTHARFEHLKALPSQVSLSFPRTMVVQILNLHLHQGIPFHRATLLSLSRLYLLQTVNLLDRGTV